MKTLLVFTLLFMDSNTIFYSSNIKSFKFYLREKNQFRQKPKEHRGLWVCENGKGSTGRMEVWKKICFYMLAGHVLLYLNRNRAESGAEGGGSSAPSALLVPQLWSGSHWPAPQPFPHPELYTTGEWAAGSAFLGSSGVSPVLVQWRVDEWGNCQYGIQVFSELMGGIWGTGGPSVALFTPLPKTNKGVLWLQTPTWGGILDLNPAHPLALCDLGQVIEHLWFLL